MAKTRAPAVQTPVTAREAKQTAIARILSQRRPRPMYRSYQDERGGEIRLQVDAPEFTAAATPDEWLDDRLCRLPLGSPQTEALITMYEACRGGLDAVPAAVRAAGAAAQDAETAYQMWMSLNSSAPAKGAAGALRSSILAAWRAARLPTRRDDPTSAFFAPEPTDWNLPRPQVTAYRTPWGNPAGQAV